MTRASEIVAVYCDAWNVRDHGERRETLERCWAPDAVYCDPTVVVDGLDALVAHIGGFHERMPGHQIVRTSEVTEHHGWLHFSWRMIGPGGAMDLDGFDVGERGEDGRLQRIVGFFAPPVPLP